MFMKKEFEYTVPDAEDLYKNKVEQWKKRNNYLNNKVVLPTYDTPAPKNKSELISKLKLALSMRKVEIEAGKKCNDELIDLEAKQIEIHPKSAGLNELKKPSSPAEREQIIKYNDKIMSCYLFENQKRANEAFKQFLEYEEEKNKATEKRNAFFIPYQMQISPWLPNKYANPDIIKKFIGYLEDCRADTLKEAINLYFDECNKERKEEKASQNYTNEHKKATDYTIDEPDFDAMTDEELDAYIEKHKAEAVAKRAEAAAKRAEAAQYRAKATQNYEELARLKEENERAQRRAEEACREYDRISAICKAMDDPMFHI